MGVQINGDTGNISATKADYSGNVTIGGTLTYEDVTNIDSVGLITARNGIEVGARPGVGASISVDGNAEFAGIVTATQFKGDGSQLSNITSVGGATGVDFNDDVKVRFGASNDLQLYHDSSANKSKIETTAGGNLDIGSTHNADVQIKTNSVNRFNFGAGGFAPLADNTYTLGTSSLRFRNVYTNDLNLSNEGGGGNDVDGTTGNYTIQEGADELYLINNKSGKKYKFNLTEVS